MHPTELEFRRMPSPLVGLVRAGLARKSGLPVRGTIPAIQATVRGLRADPEQVRRYAALCGEAGGSSLPLAYPHVLAAPLHLAVMTHADFPLRLPGLVHVANRVRRYRHMGLEQAMDLQVQVEGHRDVERGLEFDLRTRVVDTADGVLLWESESTMLARRSGNRASGSSTSQPDMGGYPELARWKAPTNIGRRYGWTAGDLNPIHLHAVLARLFGFPQAIAHGMWSFARCAAVLLAQRPAAALELDVVFRRPLLLPGEAVLLRMPDEPWAAFVLTDPAREQRYLSGRLDLL